MKWFQRKRWNDIDWCDRNIIPKQLSDKQILTALPKVHPYSLVVEGLLFEAHKRGLSGVLETARKYADHPEPEVSIEAVSIIRLFGTIDDAAILLQHANKDYNDYYLASLLEAAVHLDPQLASQAMTLAENKGPLLAKVSVFIALPEDYDGITQLLLECAKDKTLAPGIKSRVFARLAELPRNQDIEDFFLSFCIDNDGSDPDLSAIANSALSQKP